MNTTNQNTDIINDSAVNQPLAEPVKPKRKYTKKLKKNKLNISPRPSASPEPDAESEAEVSDAESEAKSEVSDAESEAKSEVSDTTTLINKLDHKGNPTNLTKLGATEEELAKYIECDDWNEMDVRGLDVMSAHSVDNTKKGERTERCSFQFKLKMSKMMLRTLQHHLTPTSGKSKTYTDVAIKTAMNQYFHQKFNAMYAMELVGNTERIYNAKNVEIDEIISIPEGFLGEFLDGFLLGEGKTTLDKQQEIHESSLNVKRKTKNKATKKQDAVSFLDAMTQEERDQFLANYMTKA